MAQKKKKQNKKKKKKSTQQKKQQQNLEHKEKPKKSNKNDDLDDFEAILAAAAKENKVLVKKIKNDEKDTIKSNGKVLFTIKDNIPLPKMLNEDFKDGIFPKGEIMEYHQAWNELRFNNKDLLKKEMANESWYNELREAAEVHRRVRGYAQKYIKPGMSMIEIVTRLEQQSKRLLKADGHIRGYGFPTGVSLNHCAAHYTPNYGDKTILKKDDVLKVDFGTQINGNIIDCAWTQTFDPKYDEIVKAVKDATNTGLKECGIDVRLCDIGAAIKEVMTSYSLEIDGKSYPVKCIENLNGHSIAPYTIHAGKSVPLYDNGDQTKMEEGEVFAIETFASANGKGKIYEDGQCSHYMEIKENDNVRVRGKKAIQLLGFIRKRFNGLAFCRRWLDDEGFPNHLMALRELVNNGLVREYPPLCDKKGSITAQFEHTIILKSTSKEIVSRGDDY